MLIRVYVYILTQTRYLLTWSTPPPRPCSCQNTGGRPIILATTLQCTHAVSECDIR